MRQAQSEQGRRRQPNRTRISDGARVPRRLPVPGRPHTRSLGRLPWRHTDIGALSTRFHGMREQRLVFGEDPELYDRARPTYPAALVDDVVELAGASARALDIGCGTAKATVLPRSAG